MSLNFPQPVPSLLGSSRLLILLCLCLLAYPAAGWSETYGIKDASGKFVPKVTVTVEDKEVVIKKVNPQEKFGNIEVRLNAKNQTLVRNVPLLHVQWIQPGDKPNKAMPLSGGKYDATEKVFKDSMGKSIALKILDQTTRNLFKGKDPADLFTISIDNKPLVSSEDFQERERTVQLGAGRDVSIKVNKSSLLFTEENYKKGEIVDVDNRTGRDQTLGITVPKTGLSYSGVVRRPDQTKVPPDQWNRFSLASDAGISIVLIPEVKELAALDGKEVSIKTYDRDQVRDTINIPVKVSSELRRVAETRMAEGETANDKEAVSATGTDTTATTGEGTQVSKKDQPPKTDTRTRAKPEAVSVSLWLWIIPILSIGLLVVVGGYAIFFMLPRIQVLEDRLSKSEMFIHGSREAIREELDEIRKEILQQCRQDTRAE
ncbi:MAG: hypothetical protein AB1473_02055 [Thermodesulfobacteriota bacterium]